MHPDEFDAIMREIVEMRGELLSQRMEEMRRQEMYYQERVQDMVEGNPREDFEAQWGVSMREAMEEIRGASRAQRRPVVQQEPDDEEEDTDNYLSRLGVSITPAQRQERFVPAPREDFDEDEEEEDVFDRLEEEDEDEEVEAPAPRREATRNMWIVDTANPWTVD